MPSPKVGDIVFADGSWFLVQRKNGQQMIGCLIAGKQQEVPYRFTSRHVERVFREMGRRRQKAQAEA